MSDFRDFREDFPPPNEAKITRELRDILDSAVRDEPPLFLDPAQIVAAGEIRSWRRRLGASLVLTVLAAVAIVATAVPLVARHGSRSDRANATSRATSHSHSVPPPPATPLPTPPRDHPTTVSPFPADPAVANQLTGVLFKILPVKISHFRSAPAGTKPMTFLVTDGTYHASGDVVDQLGYGHIIVTLSDSQPLSGCGDGERSCYNEDGPYGAYLTVRTGVQPAGGHDWTVTADRMDGVEVTVEVFDYTLAAAEKGSAPSQRDAPPLTVPQMIDLATDPQLAP